ncbi:MAG: DUF6733 family protein [Bacteroidota bacterium]
MITLFRKLILCFIVSLSFFLSSSSVFAQEEEDRFSMNVSLNSDIFFGFYPFFAGSYATGDNIDFTFYGILWSGGTGGTSGTTTNLGWGNWTEFGVGIGFPVGPSLYVNPQIGLLNGSLTSGLGTPALGEGFVPNITIGLDNNNLEGELYAGYYVGFDQGNPVTNNYLHYWVNGGYKVSSVVSLGLHLEHLRFTGGDNQEDDAASDLYVALGPYIQFADPKGGVFARFTSGLDLRSDEEVAKSGNDLASFFKLTVGYGF